MYEYKQFYRRKLPHIHSPNGTLFITFRLANSIPKSVIARYKNEKTFIEHQIKEAAANREGDEVIVDLRSSGLKEFHRNWFRKFEEILHKDATGPDWLKREDIASIIAESFLHRNGVEFNLRAFCIMSNHVHVVFRPFLSERSIVEVKDSRKIHFESTQPTLGAIMRSLKGFTARKANKVLGRTAQFWEIESYDHEVRDENEFSRIVRYVLQNPVKAKLVDDWRKWKWTWLAEDLQKYY